jgi:hypothetical protein
MTETAESTPEETPIDGVRLESMTYDQLLEFFVNEGVWLEEQTDNDEHDDCPACRAARASLDSLRIAIINVVEQAEKQHEVHKDDEDSMATLANILETDRQWYEIAKAGILNVYMETHKPYAILRAHPDIKRPNTKPGLTKATVNKSDRKAQRKRQRAARKRGRG